MQATQKRGPVRMLIVDGPNLDMRVGEVLGRKPGPGERPVVGQLANWLVNRSEVGDEIVAAYFVNVPSHADHRFAAWVQVLRSEGFSVFARPKVGDSDVDLDMIEFISAACRDEMPAEVIVVSHDAQRFLEPLEDLARAGTKVVAMGFEEHARRFVNSELVEFVDVEDVPMLFVRPLPRTRLTVVRASEDGTWLAPTRQLRPVGTDRRIAVGGVA